MRSILLQFSTIVLSFFIIITGGPFQLYFQAHAQGGSSKTRGNSTENDGSVQREESLQQLRRSFLNPKQGEAHLDPFLLINQRVIDDRITNVDAVTQEARVDDYLERVEYYETRIQELVEFEKIVEKKIQGLPTGVEQKLGELNQVLSDIISRKKIAQIEAEDLKDFDPRKGEGLPIESMINEDLKQRHYWGRRMKLQIFNAENRMENEISQRDFTESLSPSFSKENPLASILNKGDLSFTIADKKGRPLHQFTKPIEAIFFFGQYLVYIEKESLNAGGKVLPIRFIDLNYFRANIGNAPLPVYTFPLNIDQRPDSFEIENGYLKIGKQKLSYAQFAVLAKTSQVVFNISVALIDPNTYKNARPLIEEILKFFSTSMKGQAHLFQEQLKQAINADEHFSKLIQDNRSLEEIGSRVAGRDVVERSGEIKKESRELIEKALSDGKLDTEEYEKIKLALNARDKAVGANHAVQTGRKLFNRIRLLMRFLVQPRPEGATKLFNSIVMVTTSSTDNSQRILKFFAESTAIKKMAKYGLGIGGTMLAASQLPEPYTLHLYQSMDLVSAMWQHFQGYLTNINYGLNYVELSKDAMMTSMTGWTYFIGTYFSDGNWPKFLYGLGQVLLIPLKLFAGIHFTVNSYKISRKTLRERKLSKKEERSFIRSFIQAAKKDKREYWESLAEAEKKSSGSDVDKMTAEEVTLLQEEIQRLKKKNDSFSSLQGDMEVVLGGKRSFLYRFKEALSGYRTLFKFAKKNTDDVDKVTEALSLKDPDTVRRALANAFFSYSSLRSTFRTNALIWNYLFISRSFFFSPSKWLMSFIYPNYFNSAVTTRQGKQHLPSHYNRGLESWPQKISRFLSQAGSSRNFDKTSIGKFIFTGKEALKNLGSFEDSIGKVEALAMEIAMKRAQMALIENVKNPERLLAIFDSSQRAGKVSTGIRSLHDKKIKKLQANEKMFYRAYFTRSFDAIMQNFLTKMTATTLDSSMDPESFARQFAKELKDNGELTFDFSEAELKAAEKQVESEINFQEIRDWSNKVTHEMTSFTKRLGLKFRHKLLESIHPQNPQVQRFLTAKSKVDEPRAMDRAMRMEVSGLFSSIPMGILSTLALYAGVKTGVIMPFDPSGLDTQTHFNYMSRYLFYSGFVPGLIIGLMANTWMKVQQDARIDDLGGFDKAITHKDGQKGFWRYFIKNVFKNPHNKWRDNQIYMLKLITANIPAAAVTISVANLYGLGRIDLGSFLGGYIVVYSTFLYGIGMKMDQGFELASSWVYNKIPRRLRAHPDAQKYINGNLQKRKIIFGYIENFWDIIVQENVAGTMLTLKDNVKFGTRSFLRLIFGGDTPTTLISNLIDKMVGAFKGIPGAENSLEAIRSVFTNNYEAFERYPGRLLKESGGVIGLQENPDLPKGAFAELIGKGAAAIGSIAIFSSVPYLGSHALEKRNERRVQKKGIQLNMKRSCSGVFATK